jgi:cytidine deaminase
MSEPLGVFTKLCDLSEDEQEAVRLALVGADNAAQHQLCPRSDFPVGACILATNAEGKSKFFWGSNIENYWLEAGICAEANAATKAVMDGYKHFQIVAVLCRRYPGGSPCGLCRQVLVQWGRDAVLLKVVDHNSNVRKALVGDLLPAAKSKQVSYGKLGEAEKKLVKRVTRLKSRSYVPYTKRPRAALFIAGNVKGKERIFEGVSDDNASYVGSAVAEAVAMRTARTAGYCSKVKLMATVEKLTAVNPVEGECLQVLREFADDAGIVLVGPDQSVIKTTLKELLPDSFGPDSM